MFKRTYFGKAYDDKGVHTGPGLWLNLVWQANRIEAGFFGAPVHLRPGVEDYAHATIAHGKSQAVDETLVTVAAKDEHGSEVLTKAAEALEATLKRESPRHVIFDYKGREAGAAEDDV